SLMGQGASPVHQRELELERVAEDRARDHHAAQALVTAQLAARGIALGHERGGYQVGGDCSRSRAARRLERMGFAPSEAMNEILERFRRFVDEELLPLEPELFARGFVAIRAPLEEKRAKARTLGLWAPHLPKEHGGMGLSILEIAYVSEVLGRTPIGHYAVNMQAPDVG